MTNSQTKARPGKRERLIASASELLHERGVQATTLAEIAEDAEVPPGNVYYYFKTRDDLVRAVIESRLAEVQTFLGSLESRSTPAARLKALANSWVDTDVQVAEHGCPLGTLCSELNKDARDGLDREAAKLFETIIDWTEAQFREMGHRDARELATTLIAGVQGASLLANTLRDPKVMRRQVRRLDRWIDSLA